MKTFYSILYVPIRPEVKERLTIGLFMRSEKQAIFRYSTHKMEVLNHLLPRQAYNLLKLALHSIERSVEKAQKHFNGSIDSLIPEESLDYNLVGEPYFQYLSKYNQNLVAFTPPQEINMIVTLNNFRKLFDKLIHEGELIQKMKSEKTDIVKNTRSLLKPKIEKNVNWD